MPTKKLPKRANITHLKHQVRDLMRAFTRQQSDAFQRIREFHPNRKGCEDAEISTQIFTLTDGQLTIAREYGFKSWPKLREAVADNFGEKLLLTHHERITDLEFRRAVDLLDAGDCDELANHLKNHPTLITKQIEFEGENYFTYPTLLEFVAENPIRNGSLPKNIIEVATLILSAGAQFNIAAVNSTLELVSSGRIAREQNTQEGLIKLLCNSGANPSRAINTALGHGELDAMETLISMGAIVDLNIASATNRVDKVELLLKNAPLKNRHEALAIAIQYGHVRIIRRLLATGLNPNDFNPKGFHSHSTPLHQSAYGGNIEVIRVLVEGGARLDVKDILYNATPLGWANHAGQKKAAAYLQEIQVKTSNK